MKHQEEKRDITGAAGDDKIVFIIFQNKSAVSNISRKRALELLKRHERSHFQESLPAQWAKTQYCTQTLQRNLSHDLCRPLSSFLTTGFFCTV